MWFDTTTCGEHKYKNKMNILLLTPVYPTNDSSYTVTPVCHYFVKEWIKAGFNVKVINFTSKFPDFYNFLARPLNTIIKARTGNSIYIKSPSKNNVYVYEGIEIYNIPIKKVIPHSYPSIKEYQKIAEDIRYYLDSCDFTPDIITGHLINPCLGVIHFLKIKYLCKSCIVFHLPCNELQKIQKTIPNIMGSIDVWGFRSKPNLDKFKELFGGSLNCFVCHSGIPEAYLSSNPKSFDAGLKKIAFLGSLFKLKKVDILIQLISELNSKSLTLDIIGGGAEESNLRQLANQLKIESSVTFWGKQPRNKAQEILGNSDCYAMISKEAFGLVYIEAMAKGLITIALKNSGIDGVIRDGINGFLCESQELDSLINTVERILSLSSTELLMISNNARATAAEMTDSKMAIKYIEHITNA